MIRFATKLAPSNESLERAWNAGFRNTEFWLNEASLVDVEPAIQAAVARGMKVVPHFPNRGDLSEAHLANTVHLYRRLDCKALVIHEPMAARFERKLRELHPEIRIAVENGRQRGEAFERWAATHQWLTLDIEHVWKFTLGDTNFDSLIAFVRKFLKAHASKVIHVHLPGYVLGSPEHRPSYFNAGLARAIWSLLEEHKFDGFVVSEAELEFQTDTHLRRDIVLFDRWRSEQNRSSNQAALLFRKTPT